MKAENQRERVEEISRLSQSTLMDDVQEKITPDQAIELKELLKSSSWTPQKFLDVLADLGCARISDLTQAEFEQLKKIIQMLSRFLPTVSSS